MSGSHGAPVELSDEAFEGLPDDATLLSGLHPQSFSLVINDDWVTGWDLSYEQIVDSLRSAR